MQNFNNNNHIEKFPKNEDNKRFLFYQLQSNPPQEIRHSFANDKPIPLFPIESNEIADFHIKSNDKAIPRQQTGDPTTADSIIFNSYF